MTKELTDEQRKYVVERINAIKKEKIGDCLLVFPYFFGGLMEKGKIIDRFDKLLAKYPTGFDFTIAES